MSDDRQTVIEALRSAGVAGADDFGYFVNNQDLLRPSKLDERAAMPVLLQFLPSQSDPQVVSASARHLRKPWARPVAFDPLLDAFRSWATRSDTDAGWVLGDALANAASADDLPILLDLAPNSAYGTSRQMIVHQLSRFRTDAKTERVLDALLDDPDVSLHAISAYRRTVGDEVAFARFNELEGVTSDPQVRKQADRAIRAIEKKRR